MASRPAALLVAIAVGAPVLAGVVLLLAAPAPLSKFGWFAYAPLQEAPPAPSVIVTNWQQCLGVALLVAASLVGAVVAGYRAGRASRTGH